MSLNTGNKAKTHKPRYGKKRKVQSQQKKFKLW